MLDRDIETGLLAGFGFEIDYPVFQGARQYIVFTPGSSMSLPVPGSEVSIGCIMSRSSSGNQRSLVASNNVLHVLTSSVQTEIPGKIDRYFVRLFDRLNL